MRYPNYEKIQNAIKRYRVIAQEPTVKTLSNFLPKTACSSALLQNILKEQNYIRFVDVHGNKSMYQWIRKEQITDEECKNIYENLLLQLKKHASFKANKMQQNPNIEDLQERILRVKHMEEELNSLKESLAKDMDSYLQLVNAYKAI